MLLVSLSRRNGAAVRLVCSDALQVELLMLCLHLDDLVFHGFFGKLDRFFGDWFGTREPFSLQRCNGRLDFSLILVCVI